MAIWEMCNVQKCPTNFRDMQNHVKCTMILLFLRILTVCLQLILSSERNLICQYAGWKGLTFSM